MNSNESKSLSWFRILLTVGIVFTILFLKQPGTNHKRRDPGLRDAVNNARQIGMALVDFEVEYDRLPDEFTIAEVKLRTGCRWDLRSDSSNDLFKQLVVVGITSSESMFYCKRPGTRKPDGNVNTEETALAAGECGFTYLPPGAIGEQDPARPLAVAPMVPGTTRFDLKPFDGKAVVLREDNTVRTYSIRNDGQVIVEGGALFDLDQPFWRGRPPLVKHPQLLSSRIQPPTREVALSWLVSSVVIGVVVAFVRCMALKGY